MEAECALVARGPLPRRARRAARWRLLLLAARLSRACVAKVAACLHSAVPLELSNRGAVDLLDDSAAPGDDALRAPEAGREGCHLVQSTANPSPLLAYVLRRQGRAEARAAIKQQRFEVGDAQHASRRDLIRGGEGGQAKVSGGDRGE